MNDNLSKRLKELATEITGESILEGAGLLARQIIEERTLAGRFLNADAPGYSDAYIPKREENKLPTDRVDLQFSGESWLNFDHSVDVQRKLVALGFNRDELAKIMSYHDEHGAGKNKIVRHFLGLTESEQTVVADYLLEKMGAQIDITLERALPDYP